MKQWITAAALAVGLIGVASHASASPLAANCGALMLPNQTGVNGSICTVTADPGFFISGLTLTASDDVTGVFGGTPSMTFSATLTQSTSVFSIPSYCGGPTSGLPCSDTVLPSGTVTGLHLSTYSVQSTNASNTVTGTGGVTGASIIMSLAATETPNTVPEPMTLSLMGAGLLGLGLLRKRVGRS